MHCNIVKNYYQQASKVLFAFVPYKQFGRLINISPHSLLMLNTINTEFSFIYVWFTDQNSKPLEIEDKVNMTFIMLFLLLLKLLSDCNGTRLEYINEILS